MNKQIQPFIICLYHLKLCLRSPRIIIMLILLFMYLHSMLEPIIDFSRAVQIKPTIWFFPFLINDVVAQLIITFGGVVMFCNAPFHSDMENYLLIRTNYRRWNSGQLLYILSAASLYLTFIIVAVSLILLLGSGIELSMNWGKIWGTLVNTNAGAQFLVPMGFNQYLYSRFLPMEAFIYSFILEWGAISLIGIISYNLNRFRAYWGTILAASITLLDLAIANDLPFFLYKISPASLAKISLLTGNSVSKMPTLNYSFLFFTVLILIGSCFAIWYPRKVVLIHRKILSGKMRRLK